MCENLIGEGRWGGKNLLGGKLSLQTSAWVRGQVFPWKESVSPVRGQINNSRCNIYLNLQSCDLAWWQKMVSDTGTYSESIPPFTWTGDCVLQDTPCPRREPVKWSRAWSGLYAPDLHLKKAMPKLEKLKELNLRALLRELRTDIAMAVDDPFPLVYGLADKNIITEQLLKVRTVQSRIVCYWSNLCTLTGMDVILLICTYSIYLFIMSYDF